MTSLSQTLWYAREWDRLHRDVVMMRAGKHLAWGLLLIVVVVGCRTPQPELKPNVQPEVLTKPPKDARYNKSEYPDVAFRDMNSRFAKPLDGYGNVRQASGMTSAPGMSPGGGPGGLGSGIR